jgi:Family of unknown function (DUF5317)
VLLIVIIVAVAVAVGFLARGSLRPLERLELRWWGVALAGLALQVVPLPHGSGRAAVTSVLAASYALLLVFVWANRRLPATSLMLIGLTLNLVVVAANGGMPVSANAVRAAGGAAAAVPAAGAGPNKHHLMSDADVLRPLADVIPGPPPLGVVLSVGDLLLYAGVGAFVVLIMLGRFDAGLPAARRSPRGYRGKHLPRGEHLPNRSRGRSPGPPLPAGAAPRGSER